MAIGMKWSISTIKLIWLILYNQKNKWEGKIPWEAIYIIRLHSRTPDHPTDQTRIFHRRYEWTLDTTSKETLCTLVRVRVMFTDLQPFIQNFPKMKLITIPYNRTNDNDNSPDSRYLHFNILYQHLALNKSNRWIWTLNTIYCH